MMYNIFCFFKMDILKEKQLTLRASRRPIEYNYTNADIHHSNTTPDQGYQFPYPVKWTSDQSTQKVIGIRRISYKPSSVNIVFRLTVEDELFQDAVEVYVYGMYTEQNTFEECITNITNQINEVLENDGQGLLCMTKYDKDLATFSMQIFYNDNPRPVNFKIEFYAGKDGEYDPEFFNVNDKEKYYYKSEFLKLFNQEIDINTVNLVHSWAQLIDKIEFNNVWNRDHFYCHASFSDSPKHIIGINKDFWPTPSVFYDYSDNSNVFDIYFTTDTQHRILPRNGVLLIQFSFIFNYTNSMLTYT